MKNSTTPFILIILSLGLFYTFISPQYSQVQDLRLSAAEYRNVIDNVSQIAETRDRLLIDYAAIEPLEIERLGKALPDTVDTVRLALDLDTLAARYGVAIKDVSVNTKPNQNSAFVIVSENPLPYEKAIVTFSFISTYDNFINILNDLEKSLRIMDIKTLSFDVLDQGLYEHKITVETYWLKGE